MNGTISCNVEALKLVIYLRRKTYYAQQLIFNRLYYSPKVKQIQGNCTFLNFSRYLKETYRLNNQTAYLILEITTFQKIKLQVHNKINILHHTPKNTLTKQKPLSGTPFLRNFSVSSLEAISSRQSPELSLFSLRTNESKRISDRGKIRVGHLSARAETLALTL